MWKFTLKRLIMAIVAASLTIAVALVAASIHPGPNPGSLDGRFGGPMPFKETEAGRPGKYCSDRCKNATRSLLERRGLQSQNLGV